MKSLNNAPLKLICYYIHLLTQYVKNKYNYYEKFINLKYCKKRLRIIVGNSYPNIALI